MLNLARRAAVLLRLLLTMGDHPDYVPSIVSSLAFVCFGDPVMLGRHLIAAMQCQWAHLRRAFIEKLDLSYSSRRRSSLMPACLAGDSLP